MTIQAPAEMVSKQTGGLVPPNFKHRGGCRLAFGRPPRAIFYLQCPELKVRALLHFRVRDIIGLLFAAERLLVVFRFVAGL
jgi:hypothetical protein